MQELAFNTISQTLVQLTVAQINKDLGALGCIALRSIEHPYIPLLEDLSATLSKLKPSELQGFIYRVDVSEQHLKAQVKHQKGQSYFKAISALVIEREFKKVYVRKLYSKNA